MAFKLGTVLGVFLLPLLAYASFRLMGFRFPAPLLGAAAALVFLFLEENPIWGGTIASTLTGEFSYTYGIGPRRSSSSASPTARTRAGGRPWLPAAVLAVTALAHGYAVLWAGLSASYFLFARAPPRAHAAAGWPSVGAARLRARRLLAAAAAGGLGLDDALRRPLDHRRARATSSRRCCGRSSLAALAGLGATLRPAPPRGRRRTTGSCSCCTPRWSPPRWPPPAPRSASSTCASCPSRSSRCAWPARPRSAWSCERLRRARPGRARPRRGSPSSTATPARACCASWIDWNYTGLEAKELWPAFRAHDARRSRGGVGDPRVAVEYGAEHEKAGSIRMYETLPFFSGRSTLEGVYNQASLQTHPVYYLASELGATSPNPFRKREYSRFDTEGALAPPAPVQRLRGGGGERAARRRACEARPGRRAHRARAALRRLPPGRRTGRGYVEPLAFAPVRSPLARLARQVLPLVHAQAASAARTSCSPTTRAFTVVETDEWLAPPARPAARRGGGARDGRREESITITTSRVGHPLLVKVSYHPRWTAEGADGPYLVSPALDDGGAAAARRCASPTRARPSDRVGPRAHAAWPRSRPWSTPSRRAPPRGAAAPRRRRPARRRLRRAAAAAALGRGRARAA